MEAVRRIQFCAGHRVYRHESKCAHPHGHNYVAFIHARAEELDKVGRVIDFSVLKERIGDWIEDRWDHGFIYYDKDQFMEEFYAKTGYKHYALELNPTAENMAKYLVEDVAPHVMKDTGVEVYKVTLWETENCYAVYSK